MKSNHMITKISLSLLITGVSGVVANAAEDCRSAKDMVRMVQAFYGAEPEHLNVIDPKVSLVFSSLNDHPIPTQMLFREVEKELYLDIDEDGALLGLETAASLSKDAEMCRVDNGVVPEDTDEDTTSVNVSFSFPFRRTDGEFSVKELMEGAKDGSKVMSGVAPGGLGFVVPGLKALGLETAEDGGPIPTAVFTRKGKVVSVPVSVYDTSQFYRLKDIKSSKADTLSIDGNYKLSAMFKFDPDDMAKSEAKRLSELEVTTASE